MNREELANINVQIKHWRKKREALDQWFADNSIAHPDFESKFREQNNVVHKIAQLEARKNPPKYEAVETFSIPPRQPGNRS
jgi:uncharacterized protein (DUF924 family)